MKIITAILLFISTITMAQVPMELGRDDKGIYKLKKDSFVIYQEKDGNEYIGLTANFLIKDTEKVVQHANYKMLSNSCSSKGTINILRVNDTNTEVINTEKIKLTDSNLPSTMGILICDYAKSVKANPEINKNSIQNIKNYAEQATASKWSSEMPLNGSTIATLTDSLKLESFFTSIITRLSYSGKPSEYYKLYIDKDFCRDEKGVFEMKSLDAIEMENIPFDLNKTPTEKESLQFHKIAKKMCEYTMKNNVFRKRIVIEDYNKPTEYKGNMFSPED